MDNVQTYEEDSTVHLEIPGKVGRTVRSGDVLGENYRLKALLGKGGMGYVYSCTHEVLHRDYALKILNPSKVNEQTWRRFEVEGKAIARLDHANIVKIFNMGIDGGDCPFYVMELLDGDTLETLLQKEGPLSLELSLEIFSQLASGIGYAHRKGIIHRDIKPSNIILQRDISGKYTVKIVDFGLAKLVDRKNRQEQGLTSAGEVFGSPLYMSPEQSTGEDVDERSDVYSFGCSLYKTLIGNPPFEGENSFQTMMWHQTREAPSLSEGAGGRFFPEELEVFVKKAIAKKPQDRYQSMDQLIHDLNRLRQGKTLAKKGLRQEANEGFSFDVQRLSQGKNPVLLIAFLLIATAVAIAAFYTTSKHTINPSTAGNINFQKDPEGKAAESQPLSIIEEKAHLADPAGEKAKRDFETFIPKKTKHYVKDGRQYLEMYFPDTSVGGLALLDPPYHPAQGQVNIPLGHPLILDIEHTLHRYTWDYPWILEKITKTDIEEIIIAEPSYTEVLPGAMGAATTNDEPVLAMLKIVREWNQLHGLHFNEYPLRKPVLQFIDTFPELDRLEFRSTENSGKELAQYKFMRKATWLYLCEVKNIDPAIYALRGSEKLQDLHLEFSTVSTGALAVLTKCPNLKSLSLERTHVTDAQLLVLCKLTHLESLSLRESTVTPEQLMRFKDLRHLDKLYVTQFNWPKEQVDKLTQVFPNMTFLDRDSRNRVDITNEM